LKNLLLALFFSASFARADVNQAKALYSAGAKLQAQKQYQAAIEQYEKSLQAEPRYAYSYKQIGTCKYYLNDKSGALEAYEKYYAAVPTDAQVKGMIDRLKASGSAAASGESPAAATKKEEGGLNPSFYLGFAIGMVGNDGSDVKSLYPSGFSPSVGTFALLEDLRAGYQFSSGLAVEGGYENYNRGATASFPSAYSSSSVLFIFAESVYFVEPVYRFQLGRKITLDGGLKLGYASLSVQSSSAYSSSLVYSGSGLMYMPEARIQFILGRKVGLDLGAGYRIDSISPLKSSFGNATDSSGGNWAANDGGLEYKLGLNIYFKRLVD